MAKKNTSKSIVNRQVLIKKPKTFKDILITDIDRFRDLKEERGITDSEMLTILLDGFNSGNNEETEGLQSEIETLKNNTIPTLQEDCRNLNEFLKAENEAKKNLETKVSELQTEIEAAKENQIKLTGNQFVCDISPKNFELIRKCRPFLKRDGKIKIEGNYPNELTNIAIPYYLKHQYDEIVNP